MEEHDGDIQPILMRTLSAHLTPMDRQVQESLNIIEETKKEGHFLSLRSEWAGAKIPGLQVQSPKGITKDKRANPMENEEGGNQDKAQGQEEELAESGGVKRIRIREKEQLEKRKLGERRA